MIPELPVSEPVGDILASLLPDLQINEGPAKFLREFRLRPVPELYSMLDLYYRAHWYAVDGHLHGYDTGDFNLDIIMERRKALEWISDPTVEDWDDTEQST
jgi:hypothetical protein